MNTSGLRRKKTLYTQYTHTETSQTDTGTAHNRLGSSQRKNFR